ncbi:glycosyltransferase family 2 protein [Gynuella sp.]|uniref:glycosyltransferase family 2 protein n=1 Tax=Gynuella sp. TaxID=2969146 RepID=UPI003D12861B
MLVSIIIRTYNEERYLAELLGQISQQRSELFNIETVIVDSGSTDNTLKIAKNYDCRITYISKSDFTFGRALNIGCQYADGDYLVFISGHCIPTNDQWITELCRPLIKGSIDYTYGRQIGRNTTKYSENQHFHKWFPPYSKIPQEGFFCNNANAAISQTTWSKFKFNEDLTGLEDMYLAKQIIESGGKVGYVSNASVYHIHDETWRQVRIRYEREAYALQQIMPEVHFSLPDFFRYFISSILADSSAAIRESVFLRRILEIVLFRFNHYWGTYLGNHEHRKLSNKMKKHYFYPLDLERDNYNGK